MGVFLMSVFLQTVLISASALSTNGFPVICIIWSYSYVHGNWKIAQLAHLGGKGCLRSGLLAREPLCLKDFRKSGDSDRVLRGKGQNGWTGLTQDLHLELFSHLNFVSAHRILTEHCVAMPFDTWSKGIVRHKQNTKQHCDAGSKALPWGIIKFWGSTQKWSLLLLYFRRRPRIGVVLCHTEWKFGVSKAKALVETGKERRG